MEGRTGRETWTVDGEGKPLKVESLRACVARNKATGYRAEQDVEGVKNVEGVAQPGQVSPV